MMLEKIGKMKKMGIMIYFKLDVMIFLIIVYNYDMLCEWFCELVFLLKGFKIELIDKRYDCYDIFYYEIGI